MKTPSNNVANLPQISSKPDVDAAPFLCAAEQKREQVRRDRLLDELTQETERLGLYAIPAKTTS